MSWKRWRSESVKTSESINERIYRKRTPQVTVISWSFLESPSEGDRRRPKSISVFFLHCQVQPLCVVFRIVAHWYFSVSLMCVVRTFRQYHFFVNINVETFTIKHILTHDYMGLQMQNKGFYLRKNIFCNNNRKKLFKKYKLKFCKCVYVKIVNKKTLFGYLEWKNSVQNSAKYLNI